MSCEQRLMPFCFLWLIMFMFLQRFRTLWCDWPLCVCVCEEAACVCRYDRVCITDEVVKCREGCSLLQLYEYTITMNVSCGTQQWVFCLWTWNRRMPEYFEGLGHTSLFFIYIVNWSRVLPRVKSEMLDDLNLIKVQDNELEWTVALVWWTVRIL